jgi:hypothetical protein
MESKSVIRICGKCSTKVLPTQEGCCPACQHEFKSSVVEVPVKKNPAENRSSWISLLVLAGIVTLVALVERGKRRRRHLKLVA